MEVILTGHGEVTLKGSITTIEDYLEAKKTLKEMADDGLAAISLKVPDSVSISSALIGFLLRLIHEEGVKLTVYVRQEQLYKVFRVLNLLAVFNVQRM